MKLLFLMSINLFSWGSFFICIGIWIIFIVLRHFVFKNFFDDRHYKREIKKEEKAQAKWEKLLKEKPMDYFFPNEDSLFGNNHYNNYTQSQIRDLMKKSSGILEILKISNLNFPYYKASWETEKEEVERRFNYFLQGITKTNSLFNDADNILKIKKELRPNVKKVTFEELKERMHAMLEARIQEILRNHFEWLKKDEGKGIKEDWKMFFDLCNKICRKDDPILSEIATGINKFL